MKICFLRHGEADWPGWDRPDDERPLTRRGRKEMKQVAKFLESAKFSPDIIVSSPLPRASQTAEIAAKRLGAKVQIEPDLAHGFNLARLQRMTAKIGGKCVMIVGHEPEFSAVIEELTGGKVKLAKAGIALVETDADCKSGELRWLFPPKLAKASK
jgi:phosphohistidine phosphatase